MGVSFGLTGFAVRRRGRPPRPVALGPAAEAALREQVRRGAGRGARRAQALLLLAEGARLADAARLVGASPASVARWRSLHASGGSGALADRPKPGRPRLLAGEGEAALERLLAEDPQDHGQHATGWTVASLASVLRGRGFPAAARTLRTTLRRMGYAWKRPRYVLGRPDPAYEAKKGAPGADQACAG